MKNFGDNIQTIGKRLINEAVSLGWNTSRYILMLFRNFHPSARRTLFFQKKIKQFNVEFMETIVIDQYPVRFELPKVVFLSVELADNPTAYTSAGMDSVT